MKEIWNSYWTMIHEVAKMLNMLMYYGAAKIYFAERKYVLAKASMK